MVNVSKEGQIFKCEICGNVVVVKEAGGGELICCGKALAMRFHRAGADVEAAGNFLVAEAFGDVGEDFPLASGQVGGIGSLPVAADHLVEGGAGELGTEEGFAGVDRFNGLHKFVGRRLLENVAVRAGLDAAQHKFGVGVHGQDRAL